MGFTGSKFESLKMNTGAGMDVCPLILIQLELAQCKIDNVKEHNL